MDALEYEKARIRMCRTMILGKDGCAACPLYDGLRHRCWLATSAMTNPDIDTIETHIDRVIYWAKEHPVKTRQSEFLKQFPNAQLNKDGVLVIDPCKIDTNSKEDDKCEALKTGMYSCSDCRKKYWLTEVPDND